MRGTPERRTKSTSRGVRRRSGVWSLSRSVWEGGKGKDEEAHLVSFFLCLMLSAMLLCYMVCKQKRVEMVREELLLEIVEEAVVRGNQGDVC